MSAIIEMLDNLLTEAENMSVDERKELVRDLSRYAMRIRALNLTEEDRATERTKKKTIYERKREKYQEYLNTFPADSTETRLPLRQWIKNN